MQSKSVTRFNFELKAKLATYPSQCMGSLTQLEAGNL